MSSDSDGGILLADDDHLIREALAQMLDLEDDLQVVAQAASGPEAVAAAVHRRVDAAVLDLQMPGLDGTCLSAGGAQAFTGPQEPRGPPAAAGHREGSHERAAG